MKDLQVTLKLLVVVLVAAVLLAAVVSIRATVREYAAYQMAVAPKSIHQMVMEMEAADQPDRSSTLLHGAGLLALAGLTFGAFMFVMRGGTDLLKERRLGRRKQRRAPSYERVGVAPRAPSAPLLPDAFPIPNENYANDHDSTRR